MTEVEDAPRTTLLFLQKGRHGADRSVCPTKPGDMTARSDLNLRVPVMIHTRPGTKPPVTSSIIEKAVDLSRGLVERQI